MALRQGIGHPFGRPDDGSDISGRVAHDRARVLFFDLLPPAPPLFDPNRATPKDVKGALENNMLAYALQDLGR
ncbi:hypothetical protein KIPB_009327 [Kipferlia bialata]|uniref:Uncharacterized protein n=1 Tax=Kipferlia bialata TaxID=797122 RepID=A0A9K3GM75_9EUKA|nr:hypothetical protein KIPB_009327 [Kipferlia bialata]|eukprot:g9327.t1